MKILFEGKIYNAYPSTHFAVEEVALINGVLGWIDHTCETALWLVDNSNTTHLIKYTDIETVFILYRAGFKDINGKTQRLRPYNWQGVKNKYLKLKTA